MSESTQYVIGIDLGTTFCCVGVYRNGNVEIIPNEHGDRTTPSYVAFTDDEILVGLSAKLQANFNPLNTILDVKRIIGRLYTDPLLQEDLKMLPFKVTRGPNDKSLINVMYQGEQKQYDPEQISGIILQHLKKNAEDYLGTTVNKAVVTVPAYFTDAQRRATKDAGAIAGLDIIKIINEPTASSFCYGLNKKMDNTVLVFDLGGGTFDTSVLEIADGTFCVQSTNGDTHLGGEDFDNALVHWCIDEFVKQHNCDKEKLLINNKIMQKLKINCEKAKRSLSTSNNTFIEIDNLYDGDDFRIKITRSKFEDICNDLFQKCLIPVDNVLRDAKLKADDIDDVVLVGGSTRIPKIVELLGNYFGNDKIRKEVHPDEAVAWGAAIQAGILSTSDEKINGIVLVDIIPLSLGVEASKGKMVTMIEKNTSIPCSKEKIFSTQSDNQPGVEIKIYEGERAMAKDNNLLGIFELIDIPPMPRGIPKIKVTFDIDTNGMLSVTAVETSSEKSHNITIQNDKNRYTEEELQEKIREAQKWEEHDRLIKANIEAYNEIENYIYNLRNMLLNEEVKSKLGDENLSHLNNIIIEMIQWVEDNEKLTAEEYINKLEEVKNIVRPVVISIYQQAEQ